MARKPSLTDRNLDDYFTSTEPAERPAIQTSEQPAVKRVKRTWYVEAETDLLLKEIQLRRYKETGEQPELSHLVDEAIKKLAS